MKKRLHIGTVAVLFCLLATGTKAQSLTIDDFSVTPTNITLGWGHVTNRYILEKSTNLMTGFEYVGDVLSTNATTASNNVPASFYRVRKVRVIEWTDLSLRDLVWREIPNKRQPTNDVYDIETEMLESLDFRDASTLANLAGLESFTSLTNIVCHNANSLTNIDLTGATGVRRLLCSDMSVSNVTLTGCASLTYLYMGSTQITNLDLSSCTSLRHFACNFGLWGEVDLSGSQDLEYLFCQPMVCLDVSANSSLRDLSCYGVFTNLDLSQNTGLERLVGAYSVEHLDLSSNTALKYLYTGQPDQKSLQLPASNSLEVLSLSSSVHTNLDLSGCVNLTNLYLWPIGSLSSLTLPPCGTPLEAMISGNTNLTFVDPTPSVGLTSLVCVRNSLTNLDVSANTDLNTLACYHSKLTSLDLSANTKLTSLWCNDSYLTGSLNLGSNTLLTYVNTTNNSLSEIIVSDTNNLPATFLYDPGVIIREP